VSGVCGPRFFDDYPLLRLLYLFLGDVRGRVRFIFASRKWPGPELMTETNWTEAPPIGQVSRLAWAEAFRSPAEYRVWGCIGGVEADAMNMIRPGAEGEPSVGRSGFGGGASPTPNNGSVPDFPAHKLFMNRPRWQRVVDCVWAAIELFPKQSAALPKWRSGGTTAERVPRQGSEALRESVRAQPVWKFQLPKQMRGLFDPSPRRTATRPPKADHYPVPLGGIGISRLRSP